MQSKTMPACYVKEKCNQQVLFIVYNKEVNQRNIDNYADNG